MNIKLLYGHCDMHSPVGKNTMLHQLKWGEHGQHFHYGEQDPYN